MIRGIKFASIAVRDQDRALSFYTDKLGFSIVTDQPSGDGQRWIELRIPGAETRVVLFNMDGHEAQAGAMSNVTFMADDVDATYRELRSRGVEFTSAPEAMPWGTYAIFEDPEGNSFVLSTR